MKLGPYALTQKLKERILFEIKCLMFWDERDRVNKVLKEKK